MLLTSISPLIVSKIKISFEVISKFKIILNESVQAKIIIVKKKDLDLRFLLGIQRTLQSLYFKLWMNSKQYIRSSLSRDRIGLNNPVPQKQINQQQKTVVSLQNPPHPLKKQSYKSYISLPREHQNTHQNMMRVSHTNSLYQKLNNLAEENKKISDRNVHAQREVFFRGKERSQQYYIEDDIDREIKSEQSQQSSIIRKKASFSKKREMLSLAQLPNTNKYLEEDYSEKISKNRNYQQNDNILYAYRQSKGKDFSGSSGNDYVNRKKYSSQSSPYQPNTRKNSRQRQRESDSPIKVVGLDYQSLESEGQRLPKMPTERFLPIKNQLQRFSMFVDNNMDAILDKVEELQKKYISLDLYFEELRQSISFKKASQTENKEISHAKHRQFKFLIGQYESKIKQVKAENERLQKESINARLKEDQCKSRLLEAQRRLKQYQLIIQNFQNIKKLKSITQSKLIEAQSKIARLQKEKKNLEDDFQQLKKNVESQQSAVKAEPNASHFISNSTLFGSYEDPDYLKQQISKLEYQNKEYEKLLTTKSSQIAALNRKQTESKMMMEKIKELNEQLERECSKLQRDIVQKQLDATEKMCSLNNSIKKKLKQYDNFKDLIVTCLDEVYKKTPKKIRKGFDSEVINKNRTNKCEVMFKCINNAISFYEDQLSIMSESLLKQFSITPIQCEKIGLSACFIKIKDEAVTSRKLIETLKLENKSHQTQIQRLRQQITSKTEELNIVVTRQQEQEATAKRLQSMRRDIPTNDVEPRQSIGNNQQIAKKKVEIDKLNKEVNRLIQQSHQKYLKYEQQIVQLEFKQKQFNSKIMEFEVQKKDLYCKISEKQLQIKNLEKSIADLKLERQNLNLKITEINNNYKKVCLENQSKINKLENQSEAFKKKLKKVKVEEKQITKFQQEFKKRQEHHLSNIQEVNQKHVKQKRQIEESLKTTQSKLTQEIRLLQSKIQDASNTEKNLISQIKQLEEKLKEVNERYSKQNLLNKDYKKKLEQIRQEKLQSDKKIAIQQDRKSKEYSKLTKKLQAKQEETNSLLKQRNEETVKCKDLEQKLSQSKIENEELKRLLNKRQFQIQNKQQQINEQTNFIVELKRKNELLQKELLERQQVFKRSEGLMQQLINQNEANKAELERKEMQIMSLIQQRQELHFRLSEDLDAKSQNMKMVRYNLENEQAILKQQLQATQMNLATTKEQLKIKNNLIQQLKETISKEKKQAVITKQTRETYEKQLKECRDEIQILTNKLDILQEQLQETKVKLNDRQQQMNNVKRDKNKYFKILEEKAQYIDQLQDAVKIKCNEVDQMKEVQQQFQEAREQFEANEQRLKNQIEELQMTIKQLEEKSIETINQLKKELTIYKQEVEELKELIEKEKAKYKIKCTKQQQLAKQLEKKDVDLMNLIKRHQQLKNRMSEQIEEKCEILIKSKSKDEKLQQQMMSRMMQLQKSNESLQRSYQSSKDHISRLQQESIELHSQIKKLQLQLQQRLFTLQNLNAKIESMDTNINDLEIKLEAATAQNTKLKAKGRQASSNGESSIEAELQQKIKQLDQKEFELHQIKQEHKRVQKAQLNEYHSNLQSYRANYTILERQLNTYKETNVILTMKCQSLEKQYKELLSRKGSPQAIILAQSNHPDFASVDFDSPEKPILRHLLSESVHQRRFEIISKVIDEAIEIKLVKEEVIHHYQQPFQICEESRYSWPSLQIREKEERQMIRSQYLQRLQSEINEILTKKQESFGPTFLNLHSNSAIQVLNCIRYQLVEYRSSLNDSILEELEFVEHHQVDFCDDVEPQIIECLQILSRVKGVSLVELQHEKDSFKLNSQRESYNHKEEMRLIEEQKSKLVKQLNTAVAQLQSQEKEIQDMIDQKEQEIEQQERYFMTQSDILKKELGKQNARADRNECNFLTVKKAMEKLLQILSSKQGKVEELQDAFQHISKICDQKDIKLKKNMEEYLALYAYKQQLSPESPKKDEKIKKKKSFFGFT